MTSKIKVDNISDQNDNNIINESGDVITVGAAGDTVAVAGNIVKSNAYQASDGGVIISQSGTTITIGASGDTVSLASGASQSGFGRSGSVDWQTAIKTANFTAASGEGYFCNTSGGAFTLTLPSSPSVGDIVALKDYGSSFSSENLTIGRGGSNLNGAANDSTRIVDNESLTLVYADATKGWLAVEEGTGFLGTSFINASGGTITTSGDDKIHTFTGPGTFAVTSISSAAENNVVSYIVAAGGGGGGGSRSHIQGGGGGGAGGFREVKSPTTPYTASPLCGHGTPANRITVTATNFPITIGGGGNGGCAVSSPSLTAPGAAGTSGSPSTFSTITSTGGGHGAQPNSNPPAPASGSGAAETGGSGGGQGGAAPGSGAAGNTPPVSPPQGNNGGSADTTNYTLGGGGGGATAVGGNASGPCTGGGLGGAGATTHITGSPVVYAAGGNSNRPVPCGAAGNAAANTGNGGSANNYYPSPSGPSVPKYDGFNGGSGVVIIRYKVQ